MQTSPHKIRPPFSKDSFVIGNKEIPNRQKINSYTISKKIIAIMDHGSWHFEGAMFIENTRYLFDITMKKRQSCRCCVDFNDSCKTFFQLSNSISYLS